MAGLDRFDAGCLWWSTWAIMSRTSVKSLGGKSWTSWGGRCNGSLWRRSVCLCPVEDVPIRHQNGPTIGSAFPIQHLNEILDVCFVVLCDASFQVLLASVQFMTQPVFGSWPNSRAVWSLEVERDVPRVIHDVFPWRMEYFWRDTWCYGGCPNCSALGWGALLRHSRFHHHPVWLVTGAES